MSIIGLGFIAASALIFIYCTAWILTPFISKTHPIAAFFPDISLLIYGPIILLIIGLTGLGGFLLKSAADRQKKKVNWRNLFIMYRAFYKCWIDVLV